MDKPKSQTYQKPKWSSKPTIVYYFEVLKNGVLIETIPFPQNLEFFIIGRNEEFSTPNFVFNHPSLSRQHALIQHHESGSIYLYDLGSTHHTFWNKKEIKPFTYIPLRLGDLLRFGESTRMYIVCSDDPKAENLAEEQRVLQNHALKRSQQLSKEEKVMFDEISQINDEIDDEEKQAFGEDDDEELRYKKKLRIEEEVNPDSIFDDKDEFYDRTLADKKEGQKVETIFTLKKQKEEIEEKIAQLEKQKLEKPQKIEESDDSLDEYMNQMTNQMEDSRIFEINEQIDTLQAQKHEIDKLIDIVKPVFEDIKSNDEKSENEKLNLISDSLFVEKSKKSTEKTKDQKIVQLDVKEKTPIQFINGIPVGLVQNEDLTSNSLILPSIIEESTELPEIVPETEKIENPDDDFKKPEIVPVGIKRKREKSKTTPKNWYETNDEQKSEWIPPPEQKGDGITKLNEKFGY